MYFLDKTFLWKSSFNTQYILRSLEKKKNYHDYLERYHPRYYILKSLEKNYHDYLESSQVLPNTMHNTIYILF